MIVHRCNYWHPDQGRIVSWHPTKLDAEIALVNHHDESGPSMGPEGVEGVEIPTTKKGLIAWLNKNFTRDNG